MTFRKAKRVFDRSFATDTTIRGLYFGPTPDQRQAVAVLTGRLDSQYLPPHQYAPPGYDEFGVLLPPPYYDGLRMADWDTEHPNQSEVAWVEAQVTYADVIADILACWANWGVV